MREGPTPFFKDGGPNPGSAARAREWQSVRWPCVVAVDFRRSERPTLGTQTLRAVCHRKRTRAFLRGFGEPPPHRRGSHAATIGVAPGERRTRPDCVRRGAWPARRRRRTGAVPSSFHEPARRWQLGETTRPPVAVPRGPSAPHERGADRLPVLFVVLGHQPGGPRPASGL